MQAFQVVFPDGSVHVPTDANPRNPRASWIMSREIADLIARDARHPITGARGSVRALEVK
jgi:hypothetical protein